MILPGTNYTYLDMKLRYLFYRFIILVKLNKKQNKNKSAFRKENTEEPPEVKQLLEKSKGWSKLQWLAAGLTVGALILGAGYLAKLNGYFPKLFSWFSGPVPTTPLTDIYHANTINNSTTPAQNKYYKQHGGTDTINDDASAHASILELSEKFRNLSAPAAIAAIEAAEKVTSLGSTLLESLGEGAKWLGSSIVKYTTASITAIFNYMFSSSGEGSVPTLSSTVSNAIQSVFNRFRISSEEGEKILSDKSFYSKIYDYLPSDTTILDGLKKIFSPVSSIWNYFTDQKQKGGGIIISQYGGEIEINELAIAVVE